MGPILCNVVIGLWPGRTRGMGARRASGTRRGHTGQSGPDSESTRSRPRLAPPGGQPQSAVRGANERRGSVTGWQPGFQTRAAALGVSGGGPDRPRLERVIGAKDAPRPDEDGAALTAPGGRHPKQDPPGGYRGRERIKLDMSRFSVAAPGQTAHSPATSGQVRPVWEPVGRIGGGPETIPHRNGRNYHYEAMNG